MILSEGWESNAPRSIPLDPWFFEFVEQAEAILAAAESRRDDPPMGVAVS